MMNCELIFSLHHIYRLAIEACRYLKIDNTTIFVVLAGIMLPFSQCYAAVQSLQCKSIEQEQHFTLNTFSVTGDIEKVIVTDSKGSSYEYLVEGIKKIPVGDEKALYGSLIPANETQRPGEIILEPDSYFEMYVTQERNRKTGSENTVFIFDHQKLAVEILNLETGKRVRDERVQQGRIALHCNHFTEYLQYIESRGPGDTDQAWKRIIEQRMVALSGQFVTAYIDNNLVFDNRFLGAEIWQNPFDMWVFQQMITQLKPDVIIETGTSHGGSTLFFATILEKVNPYGQIISIEIDPDVDRNISKARSYPVFSKSVRMIKGDSVSDNTITQIQNIIDELVTEKNNRMGTAEQQDFTVMVTLDSLHSAEHVLQELKLYSRFVNMGSYIVVQDTIIDHNPKYVDWFVRPWAKGSTAGPAQAVAEFLVENSNFQRDRQWEKYYFTFYPGGFLKKTR